MLVETGSEHGGIEHDEKEMIHGVIELAETKVHEVMVPRIGIRAVDVNDPIDEVLDVIVRAGHSRLPVFDENLDDIIGILYAKDLLPYLNANGSRLSEIDLRKLVRPPVYVPETKAVDELLHEMQVTKRHMAIVVDEYGGTAGLITMEDVSRRSSARSRTSTTARSRWSSRSATTASSASAWTERSAWMTCATCSSCPMTRKRTRTRTTRSAASSSIASGVSHCLARWSPSAT